MDTTIMSLDISGCDAKVAAAPIHIPVSADHPLIKLANAIPWSRFATLAMLDLKRTTAKGCWWTGRKLRVRLHLAAYFLQKPYDLTDREVEYGLRDNAAYRLFCGFGIVAGWHPPDHTKVEEFRSRLSPETQRTLANELAKVAVNLGFADPSATDFDSTVQEANIAYLPAGHPERSEGPRQVPPDPSLRSGHWLRQWLAGLGRKVLDFLRDKTRGFVPEGLQVDMKTVKAKARAYFFMTKNVGIEQRRSVFAELHGFVKKQMRPVIDVCGALDPRHVGRMPWNIRRAWHQVNTMARRYLLDVAHFIRTHKLKTGKVLSFHALAVTCIKKGKVGKDKEFGRVFQLARIAGNFMFVGACTSLKMNDKQSFPAMVAEHAGLFGEGVLRSAAADKGYWAASNQQELTRRSVKEIGLQRPANTKNQDGVPSPEIQSRLRDRRAGIEGLIGRTKHGGQLGRSRMRSDAATLAAGYSSVLGFNLRQVVRHQAGKTKLVA